MNQLNSAVSSHIELGISLGMQLVCGLMLLLLIFANHGASIVGVTKLLHLEPAKLRAHRVDFKAFGLIMGIALSLFALHLIEIITFAAFYLAADALDKFEEALFFSISAFTTLSGPDGDFPREWRILAALEGLAGFLLIGWSTAVFVTDMNKLLRERPTS